MNKIFAIAEKVSGSHTHGGSSDELHICPKDAWSGDMSFHPVFSSKPKAERYADELRRGNRGRYKIVELKISE